MKGNVPAIFFKRSHFCFETAWCTRKVSPALFLSSSLHPEKEKAADRGWGGWMASLTPWTWVWASSRSWWWTGMPGVPQSLELQRVEHNWVTELKIYMISTDKWIKKMWYIYTMEHYFSHKKKWNFVTYNNMDELWGHYSKRNKWEKD